MGTGAASTCFFKKRFYLFFSERVRKKEREGEKHQLVVWPRKDTAAENVDEVPSSLPPSWMVQWEHTGLRASVDSSDIQISFLGLLFTCNFYHIERLTTEHQFLKEIAGPEEAHPSSVVTVQTHSHQGQWVGVVCLPSGADVRGDVPKTDTRCCFFKTVDTVTDIPQFPHPLSHST